jgi:hypothetical protein
MSQPADDLLIQIGTDPGQYREAFPACMDFFGLFRPQKGTACGASERPL